MSEDRTSDEFLPRRSGIRLRNEKIFDVMYSFFQDSASECQSHQRKVSFFVVGKVVKGVILSLLQFKTFENLSLQNILVHRITAGQPAKPAP